MEAFTDLATDFTLFAQEAQRLCAAAGPNYQGYTNLGQTGISPNTRPYFAIAVFDTSKADSAHPCGQICHQTSYEIGTPDAALTELARLLGVTYPPPPVHYMTMAQKEEIIRLLNHPKIRRPEKTRTMLAYNRWDEERAAVAIAKIRKTIENREAERPDQLASAA